MDWQNPQTLYFILPACAAWLAISLYSQSRRMQARQRFVQPQMTDRILPLPSRVKFWSKLLLQELAILMGLVAMAGPRFGEQIEQVIPRGSDLYVLIDVSRSMLADDVLPSRLGRAKADVASLVNRLEGERIGLIAFAGQAVVKCPLTVDYTSFRRALEELDPNSAPRGGTAIGDAIRKSLEVFQANSERDQALLLITDGDDQQSYPMEAASAAAERKVTIFAVGLGDAEKGSRIPQKPNSGTFLEHQGEQVWSKLDSTLLQDIALKTSGVYIPAGTRSYDLGELYTKYLQGRRGDESAQQTRVRRAERFQIFLAIALIAILVDLGISPFQSTKAAASAVVPLPRSRNLKAAMVIWLLVGATQVFPVRVSYASDSAEKVREGLKLYADQKFEEAGQAFAEASSKLDKAKSPQSAVALFDEACAYHRKGDLDKARDRYLQAGLSRDRDLATAAHFNLGLIASEQARIKAGDRPELVEKEKRSEIIDHLKQSIASYRHCLELNPKHPAARKNIEITRQWVKYYSDKWNELDRQKRRNETNLIQFLEFIMEAENSMRDAVGKLTEDTSADVYVEFKRIQDELVQELPSLKDKVDSELRPKEPAKTETKDEELEKGIEMLQGWIDEAEKHMTQASSHLARYNAPSAAKEQKLAYEELDRCWDAIVPFQPLLAKELGRQTEICQKLGVGASPPANEPSSSEDGTAAITSEDPAITSEDREEPPKESGNLNLDQSRVLEEQDWQALLESQQLALRKTQLLVPKAEAELKQLESEPPSESEESAADPNANSQSTVDPEQRKAGYQKAIELAPQAVNAMVLSVEQMRKKDRARTATHAEEAKRILQEIQDAQPKNPQQDQQNQNQQNQDQQQDQDQKKDGDNGEDKKQDQQEDKNQDGDKNKDKEKEKSDPSKQDEKKQPEDQKSKSNQVSKDRIEDAMRKVREREQAKHDRDRQLRAKIIGRTPVDKDW